MNNDDASIQMAKDWRKRHPRPTQYVYFIRCEAFVKIGVSATPEYRAQSFATSNPFDCELLGAFVGGQSAERELHEKFKAWHHRYEWFHLNDDLRNEIANLCEGWVPKSSIYRRTFPKPERLRQPAP